jgi:hypothetical protein
MPKADLRTGPLFTPAQRDLFYLADSGLYVWGPPQWIFSDDSFSGTEGGLPQLAAAPNPFTSTVRLECSQASGAGTLTIFNILGQRVRTYDLSTANGSTTSIEWDGRDNTGRTVPSGVYFARLSGGQQPAITKLVLLR